MNVCMHLHVCTYVLHYTCDFVYVYIRCRLHVHVCMYVCMHVYANDYACKRNAYEASTQLGKRIVPHIRTRSCTHVRISFHQYMHSMHKCGPRNIFFHYINRKMDPSFRRYHNQADDLACKRLLPLQTLVRRFLRIRL
jgi:hypothetical protein